MSAARAWDWRKASGGAIFATDLGPHGRLFHAYDVNDNGACEASLGLIASCEPPNEGSRLCPACVEVVKAMPAGRDKRQAVAQ